MNNKFITIIILILVLAGGYFAVKKYSKPAASNSPAASASPTPSLDPKEAEYQKYLLDAMNYRTAGFAGDKTAFYKAIDAYKKAEDVSGGKVWVPYLNMGNTYRLVEDYKNADDSYNKALEISPGEGMVYLAKIEMYRYELKKTNAEIDVVYTEALKRVNESTNLMISYASFLRDIGKYSDSLKYYKILSQQYPANQAYKDAIADLNGKIK